MPELTRRRSTDAPEECWHIYRGDIHPGTIEIRSGIPFDEDPWGWSCGFYPGSQPSEHEDGTAASGFCAHRFRKCPCGEVMHGPKEVLVHVPHITAIERAKVAGMSGAD
jgi:hypothetical protein